MSKMKKVLLTCTAYALVAVIAIGGTLAWLQDDDSDVNVMTLGNVDIRQNEQQRVEANGEFTSELENFEQGKILMPVTYPDNRTADTVKVGNYEITLSDKEANYVDKIVSVTNTGKSEAYVRTLVAIPTGGADWEPTPVSANNCWLHWNLPGKYSTYWTLNGTPTLIEVDGIGYYVWEFVHKAGLAPDETTYPMVRGFYMDQKVDNDDEGYFMTYADGTTKRITDIGFDDTVDILVLSQAAQTAGFADAQTALNTAFGEVSKDNATDVAEWFSGLERPILGTQVTADNIADIDFSAENTRFVFSGEFGAVAVSELGEGSEIYFNNATVGDLKISDDAVLKGTATVNSVQVERNSADPVALTIAEGDLDITGELGVRNTDGKSVLNVENSNVDFGTIFVGQHTNNHPAALAEFNVTDSTLSGEENGLGSTINIWGKSGVNAKIYDSEIYTYSRGWHQSEDANDNAITFQGDEFINVDIQRSNMHLYGARSIVYARPYSDHDGNCEIDFTIDESLVWSVTKSSHGEDTLPVWGATEITDSMLLFTKNVHQSTPAVFKSFVYGNPVIHGDYHVTTQCQWDAPIALADGQTVTFANDANVSIYDGAGNVEFVKTGSAKVVVEDGAVVKNINGIN